MTWFPSRVEPQEGLYPHLGQSFHCLVQFLFKVATEHVVLSKVRDFLQDARLLNRVGKLRWVGS